MSLLAQLFTWWNGQTLGTRLHTWRNGVAVGEDAEGNKYYQTKDGKRRWVIYNGEAEASRVPAEWHGWLHQTFQSSPVEAPLPRKSWQKNHMANATGTDQAYHPAGSILEAAPRPVRDYEAWKPE